jgi:hypothetical protein
MCHLCEEKPHGVCDCGCGRPVGEHGCTSHAKTTGVLCNGSAVTGRCVCRMHSANARRGPDHPNWIHGKFSNAVPARYVETAVRALDDPDFSTNRKEISLLDARASELFSQLDEGGHAEQMARALEISAELSKVLSLKKPNPKVLTSLQRELHEILEGGVRESLVWRELMFTWEQRRKSIETDSKIAFRQKIAMSHEQAAALQAIIIMAAFEVIDDEEARKRFADRIEGAAPKAVKNLTRGQIVDVN